MAVIISLIVPKTFTARTTILPPTEEELDEEIITDEQSLAEELGFSYYETRPNDKKITEQIFHDLTLKILERKGE